MDPFHLLLTIFISFFIPAQLTSTSINETQMVILLSLPRSHGDPLCYHCMFISMQSHCTLKLQVEHSSWSELDAGYVLTVQQNLYWRSLAFYRYFLGATGSWYKHTVFFWQDFKKNLNSVNTIIKNEKCLLVLSNTYTVWYLKKAISF